MKPSYQKPENRKLAGLLPFESLTDGLDMAHLPEIPGCRTFPLVKPDADYKFLHEAAVIVYHGVVFCSWYNCSVHELQGFTPIRGCRSRDGGNTWSAVEVLAQDPEQKLISCPPVYGICDDTLYMLINTMVSADHMHSLDLYRYDEAAEQFRFLRSEPIPFKLNTNVCTLGNGKLMLPGRIAEPDSFPSTPAVLISDSGKIDAPWRLVSVQENDLLPDGTPLVHPEQTAIILGDTVTMFCRNDHLNVPLLYRSADNGETWTGPIAHDIPFVNSKIYAGTLSDGRNYVIGNISTDELSPYGPGSRSKLALFLSEPGKTVFTKGWLLRDGYDPERDLHPQWSYPAAYEDKGRLYIIYTMVTQPSPEQRGAMMSIVDTAQLV